MWNMIRKAFINLYSLMFGQIVYKKLVRNNPGVDMVFTLENIGDQCMELAYLREFTSQENIKTIAVLTTNPNHAVFQYYKNQYDLLIPISKWEYQVLWCIYRHPMIERIKKAPKTIKCVYYLAGIYSRLYADNKYLTADIVQKAIYHIPLNALPSEMNSIENSEWVDTLISSNAIDPQRTVLLNPYANSQKSIPDLFFEQLTSKLLKEGLTVITSLAKGQRAVKGSRGLEFPLDKSVSLAEACGYVVGLRSGFLDLIAPSQTRIISIDNPETYHLAYAFTLEKLWPSNKRINTFHFDEFKHNMNKLVEIVVEIIVNDLKGAN